MSWEKAKNLIQQGSIPIGTVDRKGNQLRQFDMVIVDINSRKVNLEILYQPEIDEFVAADRHGIWVYYNDLSRAVLKVEHKNGLRPKQSDIGELIEGYSHGN
ncbi:hypothetical protein IC620_15605 [Hazenella sp. IB182357]|uniref:Uncharacterized protein n=1 Tax=Polycladospora coralii TaxID=2771432 RepID=A0A926RYS5_9BACL|nr:hypothetical protein [Polycladospora coralii]MBD1373771.1 hypothetical protein [Polycladospora coralii]